MPAALLPCRRALRAPAQPEATPAALRAGARRQRPQSLAALLFSLIAAIAAIAVVAPIAPGNARAAEPAAAAAPAPAATPAPAAAPAAPPPASLDTRVQDLKAEVIRLNRDLLVLEEELLFPAGTQVALFVSMDVGKLFELESVQIKLDDKVVASYLYTPAEVQALHRGAVQRVYVGNLRAGSHAIDAFFTGRGPLKPALVGEVQRDYKRGTTLQFDKGTEPRWIELRIKDTQARLQPEFEVKLW